MADIEKLTVTLQANIAQYNADLAKAQAETAQRTAAVENSFSKLGTFGARPVQNFDTIAKGMSSIGKAALQSQVENELLNASLGRTGDAAGDVSHAIGAMSTQGMAAFHALRGGAEQILQGQDPLRVLAMELNNITYAASGAGGLKGAVSEAFGIFARVLNPVVVGVLGIGTTFIGAVAAATSFSRSQDKVALSLTGVGANAGITAKQIEAIGEAAAQSGDLSISEATTVATAIASTGRVSADATKKATDLAYAYSRVFNVDLDKSAQQLADALADPAKGIDTLNERTGAWSASQVELVKNLAASGNRAAADQVILDGLTKTLADASKNTDWLTASLNAVGNAFSNAFRNSGKALSNIAPGTDVRRVGATGRGSQLPQQIADQKQLTSAIDDTRKAAVDSRDAAAASQIVTGIDPTLATLDALQTTIEAIEKQAANLSPAAKGVADSVLASLKAQHDNLLQNYTLSKEQLGVGNAQYEIDKKSADIQIAALSARTPLQKAQIAYQETLNSLQGKDPAVAQAEAQLAYNKSLADSYHALSEAQRDRIYQAGQSVEQAQIENSTIGQSVDVVTTLTQRFQLLAAAQAEAHKNGTVVSPEELAAMDQAAQKLGKLAEAQAALKVQNDAKFDIAQLGRDQSEQNVYSTLHAAGLLDQNGHIRAQDQQTAALLRTKDAMSQLADVEKGFATSFLADLEQGKSAAKALGDALNTVASKLLDLGIDNLISGLKPANSGLLSLLGLGGGDVGLGSWAATVVPGLAGGGRVRGPGSGTSDSVPAMLSDGEFVVNADATKKNRPLLEAINSGKIGRLASGGLVGPAIPNINLSSVAPASSGAPQIVFNAPLINAPNATPAAVDKMNQTSIPALKSLIRSEIVEAMSRDSRVINKMRKG